MITPVDRLNQLSLREFPELFASLEPPRADALRGLYQGIFVGPAWLRRLAGPLLVVTGLGGWWGKEFAPEGNAINLVRRRGKIVQRFPMRLVQQNSFIDNQPGLALSYAPNNPFPWPWILDELRTVSDDLVLGMTIGIKGPFQRIPLPFVLEQRETLTGVEQSGVGGENK